MKVQRGPATVIASLQRNSHCMFIREGAENDDQEPGDLPKFVHLEPTRMGKCVAYIYVYDSAMQTSLTV